MCLDAKLLFKVFCSIMSGNLLSSLAPGSFSDYPSLETLVLNDNLFTEVPSEGFRNLSITNL